MTTEPKPRTALVRVMLTEEQATFVRQLLAHEMNRTADDDALIRLVRISGAILDGLMRHTLGKR